MAYIKQFSVATDTMSQVLQMRTSVPQYNQGDVNTAKLSLTVTHQNAAMDLTGASVSVVFQKSDGKVVYQDTTNGVTITDAVNGKMDIMLNTQTRTAPGVVTGAVRVTYSGNQIIETEKFSFNVEASLASDQAIASANEVSAIIGTATLTTKAQDIKGAINEVNASLASKMPFVIPEMYGAKGDGIHDDTSALQSAVNDCVTNNKVLRGTDNAVYGITGTITVTGFIDIYMNNSTIKALSTVTDMFNYNFPSGYRDSSQDYLGHMCFNSLHLEGNGLLATNGITITTAACITFINTKVRYCQTGINVVAGSELLFQNIYVRSDASSGTVGIHNTANDCLFNFIYTMDCYTGIMNNGLNHMSNVHMWMSKNFNGSTGLSFQGGELFVVNMYLDSFNRSIYSNASSQLMLTNINTFINVNLYNNTYNAPVIFYSDGTQKFVNTSLTNSYIGGSSNTTLSNQSNLRINDSNVSYDLAGDWVGIAAMNKQAITLPGGIVNNPDSTYGISTFIFKVGDYSKEIHLNINCSAGFTNGMTVATGLGTFKQNFYVSCILTSIQYIGTDINQGVLVFQTNGNVVLKHNLATNPTYLICNTVLPGRA